MTKMLKVSDKAHEALLKHVGWQKYSRYDKSSMQAVASKAILEFIKKKQVGE